MRQGRNAGAISWLYARARRGGLRSPRGGGRRQRLYTCARAPLWHRLIYLPTPPAVAPMPGHQRRAHAAAAVEMAARTVHLAEQLFAVRDGELVSLEPRSDRVRRERRSDAVGEKAGDGNLVGSAPRAR